MSDPSVVSELQGLDTEIQAVRAGQAGAVAALCARARSLHRLRGALPAVFETVLLNLLDRLESSALFQEESCSFSQRDLLDQLDQWLVQAKKRLDGSTQA